MMTELVGTLIHCTHPDRQALIAGSPHAWCGRCGSIHWDGRWQRPSLHEDLGDVHKVAVRAEHKAVR